MVFFFPLPSESLCLLEMNGLDLKVCCNRLAYLAFSEAEVMIINKDYKTQRDPQSKTHVIILVPKLVI